MKTMLRITLGLIILVALVAFVGCAAEETKPPTPAAKKPAAKPAPAEKAPAGEAEGDEAPNPILKAKVGDWAMYEMKGGMKMKYEVTQVTEEAVTLKTDTMMNDKVVSSTETEIPLKVKEVAEKVEEVAKPKMSKGKATVKDKELECTIVEVEAAGMVTKSWISCEIPVNGIVKTETNGDVTMQLVDWGKAE